MVKTLYLIRHAEPQVMDGKKGSLSHRGRVQATNLARRLRQGTSCPVHAAVVLHAEAARCRETANILATQLSIRAVAAPLRFRHADRLRMKDMQSKYSSYLANYARLGIEAPSAFVHRLLGMVNDRHEEPVLIVANEVNIRAALQILAGTAYNAPVCHACCYKITLDGTESVGIERIGDE